MFDNKIGNRIIAMIAMMSIYSYNPKYPSKKPPQLRNTTSEALNYVYMCF